MFWLWVLSITAELEQEQEKQGEKITSERNALAEHWAGFMPLDFRAGLLLSQTLSFSLLGSHSLFPFILNVCLVVVLLVLSPNLCIFYSALPDCSWLRAALVTLSCVTMSGVVLEMLSRPEEVGFPDLVTVMRNLSTDNGMPTLPPGGGLASK